MWLLFGGFIVHIIFLISMFDIYFKSPIIHVDEQYANSLPPPAKRLVLFVADGLRAQSLFNYSNEPDFPILSDVNVPFLKFLIENEAPWGVSSTRVPTESRPGHVALIGGFYEDPSAVMKGWKENPVDFDSVLNQSRLAWCWGSPDILPIFSKGITNISNFMYSSTEEKFGKKSTTALDIWVFDKVLSFFKNSSTNEFLKHDLHQEKITFFLHLLGVDTAGHSYKPHSWEYKNNIEVVDWGIQKTVKMIEKFYNYDGKTAYIFTSDHGMTNWGSHGAGHPTEIETPLIAWGAGISNSLNHPKRISPSIQPRMDVHQADIAVLMSTLIGIPIPMNSIGTLPENYLNTSLHYKADSLFANAKQIIAQFKTKRQQKEKLHNYKSFLLLENDILEQKIHNISSSIEAAQFEDAIVQAKELISLGLLGINYYQNFYKTPLLLSITSAIILWMIILFRNISRSVSKKPTKNPTKQTQKKNLRIMFLFYFIVSTSIAASCQYFHHLELPFTYYIYFILPQGLLAIAFSNIKSWSEIFSLNDDFSLSKILTVFLQVLFYVFAIECLVFVFFERLTLCGVMAILCIWLLYETNLKLPTSTILQWIGSCFILGVFPVLPVISKNADFSTLALGGVALILIFTRIVLIDMWLSKNNLYENRSNLYIGLVQLVLIILSVVLSLIIRTNIISSSYLEVAQSLCWIISGLSLSAPFFVSTTLVIRLIHIVMAVTVPFMLLSVTFEPMFLIALSFNLQNWLDIELKMINIRTIKLRYLRTKTNLKNVELPQINLYNFNTTLNAEYKCNQDVNNGDFRRAYFCLFYILISFFGTGNIASINSFDPMWVICFVSVFNPFLMMTLIICKTVFLFIITTVVFRAVNIVVRASFKKLLYIIWLYCDLMIINFLYLVKNEGSWLDIGLSISHFIIIETTVLFIVILYSISTLYTSYTFKRTM